MKIFKIWNHIEKSFMYDTKTGTPENGWRDMEILKFKTKKSAEQWKENYLNAGNYPDHPHTVLEIIEEQIGSTYPNPILINDLPFSARGVKRIFKFINDEILPKK